jgi:mannose/fructose-specific phosphotransferase system component IIA
MQSLRDLPNVRVISGVNLPMLVDFLLRRKDQSLDGMVERLLQRGRNSVQLLKGSGK